MQKQNLSFKREKEMTIYYDDIHIGTRRVDFFCGRHHYVGSESRNKT